MPEENRGPLAKMELKVPPPVTAIIFAAAMWLASWATPGLHFTFASAPIVALLIAGAGAWISAFAMLSFVRAKTTINPMSPDSTSSLVTSGLYRFTRNPMYLALLLMLIGFGVFLRNALSFAFLPLFVLYMNRFQIAPEEKALSIAFGSEFSTYASKVRRWL